MLYCVPPTPALAHWAAPAHLPPSRLPPCSRDGSIYHICNPSFPKFDFWGQLAQRHGCWLLVRTWTNSVDDDPFLRSHGVVVVRRLVLPDGSYSEPKGDHAKLAVSHDENAGLVVVGDLNHTKPQKKRGGGGVVIRDLNLWRALRHGLDWQPDDA